MMPLLKIILTTHCRLIKKYSSLPGLESIKNQESEKSPKEIIRIKREQGEEKQDSTYSIRSTDKVALKEFDLKSALFKHMNKNKNANRNPANYHLYHALMEALIADEDAQDKELQSRLKTTREKHDIEMKKMTMMMKALQLDHTRVGQQREEDPNLPLLGQLSLLRKMITKAQRNHGSLMHLLPYNIQLLPQLDGRSLTQEMMLLTL
ncbi:hypothetical protein Tco_0489476 [Tanacetum coccineum]